MAHAYLVWLILFIILLVLEIATMGLTTIWFAIGALAAFFADLLGAGIITQIVVFLAVSVLTLILTRPVALKYFNPKREKTNAQSLIGQKALVTERIDSLRGVGRAEAGGMEWSAKTKGEEIIEPDTVVIIKGIEGVKLVVEKMP